MENEQAQQHRQHAIDGLAREVRQARQGGGGGQGKIDRLAAEWPELARALGRVLHEHNEPCPDAWRSKGTPGSGRVIVLD